MIIEPQSRLDESLVADQPPQSTGHNVRRAIRCLTISENRMGRTKYTKFQTPPNIHSYSSAAPRTHVTVRYLSILSFRFPM